MSLELEVNQHKELGVVVLPTSADGKQSFSSQHNPFFKSRNFSESYSNENENMCGIAIDEENDTSSSSSSTLHINQHNATKHISSSAMCCEGGSSDELDKTSLEVRQQNHVTLSSITEQVHEIKGRTHERKTSFSNIEIQEFYITIGDNPGGTKGPPVTLDWDHKKKHKILSLEQYEQERPPRRTRDQLYMTEQTRKWRLFRERGLSLRKIDKASKEANRVRTHRMQVCQPNKMRFFNFGKFFRSRSK